MRPKLIKAIKAIKALAFITVAVTIALPAFVGRTVEVKVIRNLNEPIVNFKSVVKASENETSPSSRSLSPSHQDCFNNPDFRYNDKGGHGCHWIQKKESRRGDLCLRSHIRKECPQTCGICCEDQPKHKFEIKSGKMKRCKWLKGDTPNKVLRKKKYCDIFNNKEMVRNMCPLACDFCQSEIEIPKAPTPTPSPTPLPSSSEDCLNNPDFLYNDEGGQDCQWIRKEENRRTSLCLETEVRKECPHVCGICCEDNSKYELLTKKGKTKNCKWVGSNINRQVKFCDTFNNKEMVRNMCPLACNFCQEPVAVTTVVTSVTTFDFCGTCTKEDSTSVDTEAISNVFKEELGSITGVDSVEVVASFTGCEEPCAAVLTSPNKRPFSLMFKPFTSTTTIQTLELVTTLVSSNSAVFDSETAANKLDETPRKDSLQDSFSKVLNDSGVDGFDNVDPNVDVNVDENTPTPTQSPITSEPTKKPTTASPTAGPPKPTVPPPPRPPPPSPPRPTHTPTSIPSSEPSSDPSDEPSVEPSVDPSVDPSDEPSSDPSVKSPVCEALDYYLGDGKCYNDKLYYNNEECGWDGGDCVEFNKKYPNCGVYYAHEIGNGECTSYYNTAECGWDGGDCTP